MHGNITPLLIRLNRRDSRMRMKHFAARITLTLVPFPAARTSRLGDGSSMMSQRLVNGRVSQVRDTRPLQLISLRSEHLIECGIRKEYRSVFSKYAHPFRHRFKDARLHGERLSGITAFDQRFPQRQIARIAPPPLYVYSFPNHADHGSIENQRENAKQRRVRRGLGEEHEPSDRGAKYRRNRAAEYSAEQRGQQDGDRVKR